MNKLSLGIIVAMLAMQANAGFNALTHHSRAMCINFNESISWDAKKAHRMRVRSHHFLVTDYNYFNPFPEDPRLNWYDDGYIYATKDNQFVNTWRAAAWDYSDWINNPELVQWKYNVWIVYSRGEHWLDEGNKVKLIYTEANDCNIYDGWWHKDHPERDS